MYQSNQARDYKENPSLLPAVDWIVMNCDARKGIARIGG
jgi:hypothetical protein